MKYRSLVRAPVAYPTPAEIAWVAGLFEGEGHVNAKSSSIFITQRDRWLLDRVQQLVGGSVGGPYTKGYERSLNPSAGIYRWWANGQMARAILLLLYLWLSPRRQAAARPMLERTWRKHRGAVDSARNVA